MASTTRGDSTAAIVAIATIAANAVAALWRCEVGDTAARYDGDDALVQKKARKERD